MRRLCIPLALILSLLLAAAAGAGSLPTAKPEQKEEIVAVTMMQAPLGRHYQQLLRGLVLQAIAE